MSADSTVFAARALIATGACHPGQRWTPVHKIASDNGGIPIASDSKTKLGRFPRARLIGLGFVFLWFLIGGIAHFAATGIEMRIVPPYIPSPRAAVMISGVFELLGAVGLLVRSTRRAAGIGLFMLTIVVTPANVYMLQHPELFSVPYWLLILRLPVQVGLLTLIVWTTGAADFSKRG